MPGRKYSNGSQYRYGFNGKEKANEIAEGDLDFGARIYDARIGRWLSTDPLQKRYPNLSPYNSFENNPIFFKDPDGKDAIVTIKGNTITISTTIYIYGKDATSKNAKDIQNSINLKWNNVGQDGKQHNFKYMDNATGKEYNVVFDTKVELYKGKEKNDIASWQIPETYNPANRNNFIRIDNNQKRSEVRGGDEGSWNPLDRSAPHEFGHLLGLDDQYDDYLNEEGNVLYSLPKSHDWIENVMSTGSKVEDRNITEIVKPYVDKFNELIKNASKKPLNQKIGTGDGVPPPTTVPTEYKGEIDKQPKGPDKIKI